MVWTRHVLSALVLLASLTARAGADVATDQSDSSRDASIQDGAIAAPPPPSASKQRLDAVFKSLQDNTEGQPITIPWKPLGIVAIAGTGMTVAIKQWNRRQRRPQPVSSHRRLLNETARASGFSKQKLKRIAPLAQAEGLSSPLVALICPSAIKRLANNVRTSDEQAALKAVAESLFRAEGRAPIDD